MDTKSTSVNRDVHLLSPWFYARVARALETCNKMGYPVALFEGWRSPERQDYLHEQGRTRPGKIVTSSTGWGSWHQYGCAVDLAIFTGGKWSWDFDFHKVVSYFIDEGLEWLNPYEQCHFQMTGKLGIAAAREIAVRSGVQALWIEIEARSKQ